VIWEVFISRQGIMHHQFFTKSAAVYKKVLTHLWETVGLKHPELLASKC
jgi:hypothetical protein